MNPRLFFEFLANTAGLKRELTSAKGSIASFARGAKREFDSIRNSLNTVSAKLAGLGISLGIMQQMTASARLDKSLSQIGQTAGEGNSKVKALRAELFLMGKQTGQNIEDLRDGFNALVQSGLTMRESKESLDGINVAMAVTGANAYSLAGGLTVAATAFQFDLSKPGKALDLLDKMTVAGRLGNAELENLSSIFARVGVNASSAGMGFEKTLGFIESLSMVERMPERLATLADSTLRVFTNLNYMAAAQKGTGVKFFNANGSRRDALEVLKDIKSQYDKLKTDAQRASFIQKAFGKTDLDTQKGLRTLLQGDSLNKVSEFSSKIEQAGGTLKRDLDDATRNLVDQAGRLKNVLREAADGFVSPINNTLAKLIKTAIDSREDGGLGLSGKQILLGGAAALGGVVLAKRYGGKLLGGLAQKFMGTASGVAEGKALEAATGVKPVFVTNWPLKFMKGESSPIDALGSLGSGGINGRAPGKLGAFAGRLGLIGTTFGAAYGLGTLIEKMFIGGSIGNKFYDWLHKDAIQNNINIRIDKDGRVWQEGNQKTSINLDRGDYSLSAYR